MRNTSTYLLSAAVIVLAGMTPASAAWQPQKPIEFVATAGPGGGTDNLARAVQNIITKYKLTDQPIVVVNKGGGSGAEGYVYGKASAGDPYKVIFGTSNAWQQPLVSKVAFNYTDLTPIAGHGPGRVPALGQAGCALQDGRRLFEGRGRKRIQDGRRAVEGHR
ncbi:tripartite-type tricarboxylate transporter receptor subunit TctC [Bradyrhizobium sp. LM2.7]